MKQHGSRTPALAQDLSLSSSALRVIVLYMEAMMIAETSG